MSQPEINFSVNDYNQDGDIVDTGIFLHFGGTRVKVANNLAELRAIPRHIEAIVDEIEENYEIAP